MLLTIHDANLQKVAFVDNDKQSTLNYYDDIWTRNLETGSSTFEFTVFKKAIKSDTASQKAYHYLNEKSFVSFRYNGKSYLFGVMTVEEDEHTITCYCENLNLELINEHANAYKAEMAMSFVDYCNAFGILQYAHLVIGINEIADQSRQLEWEGQDTKLARLLSLARKFNAEIDFETHLNADSTIKAFKLNVYHENDGNHQGVGRVRNDVQLVYGKNLKSITRKIDKTGIYTMVRPTGKRTVKNESGEDVQEIVTIEGLTTYSENNSDGVREFYQDGDALYAPIAAQMYPSTFTNSTQADQWIRKDLVVDSDNPTVIRAAGLRNLKKHAYPAISYEVDGWLDVENGDTVRIYDDGFNPFLLVQARVADQKISFTNPSRNKTTFANFKALENRLSDGIQSRLEKLFEANRPYAIRLATDNGIAFKNGVGESIITPTLTKGGKPVDCGWRWEVNGRIVSTSPIHLVRGSQVVGTLVVNVSAWIDNQLVARDQLTFINTNDGQDGQPGADGQDGRSFHFFTTAYRYAQDAINRYTVDGYSGTWVVNESTAEVRVGDIVQMSVYNTDKSAQSWVMAVVTAVPSARSLTTTSRGLVEKGDKGTFEGTIGGTNLMPKTKELDMSHNARHWQVSSETYRGLLVKYHEMTYQGLSEPVLVTAGETYTFSAYVKRQTAGRAGIYIQHNGTGSGFATTNKPNMSWFNNVGTDWQRLSVTFTATTTGTIVPRVETSDTVRLSIAGYKLERGTVATDWSPHLDDIDRSVDQKLDELAVGGRNYIRNSDIYISDGTKLDFEYSFGSDYSYLRGKTVIVSVHVNVSGMTNGRVGYEFNVTYDDGTTQYLGAWGSSVLEDFNHKRIPSDFNGRLYLKHTFKDKPIRTFRKGGLYNQKQNGIAEVGRPKLEFSTVASDWTPAPEDIEADINSKADQGLTQEQLNLLHERSGLLQAELEAKASMDTLNQLMVAYNNYTAQNNKDKTKSEADLIRLNSRLVEQIEKLGELAKRWEFLDRYFVVGNEGLVFGELNGTSYAKMSSDRFSIFSAGNEVMYVSKGTLFIENGIFSKSVQIGRFVESQHQKFLDVNEMRYVGG